MKIVYNECYGGFGLSTLAASEMGHTDPHHFARNDPRLVEVVERLGAAADNRYSRLKIFDVPDGSHWMIEEYDGFEGVVYSAAPIYVQGKLSCRCCRG